MRSRGKLSLFAALLALAAVVSDGAAAATAQAQSRALVRLADASTSGISARADAGVGRRTFVRMKVPVSEFSQANAASVRGQDFWHEFGAAFGVSDPEAQLSLSSNTRDAAGGAHLRYDQRYKGLSVFGGQLVLHLDAKGAARAVNGDFARDVSVSTTPAISESGAVWTATRRVPARELTAGLEAEQLVFVDPLGKAHLAWEATVTTQRPLGIWRVFVDAHTGEVLRFHNDLHTARNRETHNNGNNPDCPRFGAPDCVLPGPLARDEIQPATGEPDVDQTHVNTAIAYDYFSSTFGRDSYDGAGHKLTSTVNVGDNYNNAFWCPDDCALAYGSGSDGEQMVYGDGDGVVFSPLGRDPDVVVHELTHAVTEKTADLDYFGQSGALNESFSDVFAAMANPANWLIGEASYTPGISGDALRNMQDPSAEGQPEHMSQYLNTVYDAAGVHSNSGIPNHAAYLVSEGAGYGIGRTVTQRLYYWSLANCLSTRADFFEHRLCLEDAATFAASIPDRAAARRAVDLAHAAVGIAYPPLVTTPSGGSLPAGVAATTSWEADETNLPFRVELVPTALTTYTQGFEASASLPPGFSSVGSPPWFVDLTPPPGGAGGARAAQAGAITHRRALGAAGCPAYRRPFHALLQGEDRQRGGLRPLLAAHQRGSDPRGLGRDPLVHRERRPQQPGRDVQCLGVRLGVREGLHRLGGRGYGLARRRHAHERRGRDNGDQPGDGDRGGEPGVHAGRYGHVPHARDDDRGRTLAGRGSVLAVHGDDHNAATTYATTTYAATPTPPPPPPPPVTPPPPPPVPPRTPAQPARCVVPNVKGKTQAAARAVLTAKKCALGKVTKAYSAKVKSGRVISQSKAPGARLKRGTKVNVVISRGKRR